MKTICAIPVLQVQNINNSLKFYVDYLAFKVDFQMRDYAGIHLGKAAIYLCAHTFHQRPVGGGAVTIVCDRIDSYYARLQELKVPIKVPVADRRYGMTDFAVTDPDGNVLTFGCEIKKEVEAPTSAPFDTSKLNSEKAS